ncbi:MAG TPA: cytochrome C [Thermoanaerobaculia bacterium]|jgi:mono/diheme cytochrome c family protein|nr:cytochrome C [Thermoanaerobaculia bacterium]
MRRILKVLVILVVLLLVAGGAALGYLFLALPKVEPPKAIQVAGTPEQVARGNYLANHVTVCLDCHSGHDKTRYANPVVDGTQGQGGETFGHADGFPGEIHVPNITPTGLAQWSDGEVLRAVTSGISRDGHPLFPLMPYPVYAQLSEGDAESLVAYLRTLPARGSVAPPSTLDFPLSLIVRTIPSPATLRADTPQPGSPEYGRYMATIAGCQFCHTPEDKGKQLPGMEFAGGHDFGTVRSANITPDEVTGIGGWSREAFVSRFRSYANGSAPIAAGDNNTVMPWLLFAGMKDEDLGAIYDYLRTVKPVNHAVEKWPASSPKATG